MLSFWGEADGFSVECRDRKKESGRFSVQLEGEIFKAWTAAVGGLVGLRSSP